MYNYILIIIFVSILILSVLIYRHNNKYNNKDYFVGEKINTDITLKYYKGITDKNGDYHLFNNQYNTISNNLDDANVLELPTEPFNSLGIYYKDLNIFFIIDKNNIIKDNRRVTLNELYPNVGNIDEQIKSIIIVSKYSYIFLETKVIIYNNTTNNIVITNNLRNKYGIDSFDFVLVNYNKITYGNPYPFLYFVKDNYFYKYDLVNHKLYNKIPFSKINIHKSTITQFKYTGKKEQLVIKNKGNYRIVCIGAGNKYGGNGGKLFYDLPLQESDKLKIIVGKSGGKINTISNDFELKNNKLPLNSACNGAGATYIYLNNKLLMVAGGGGGHSSALVRCPPSCHSYRMLCDNNMFSNTEYMQLGKINLGIKEIVFMSPRIDNKSFKLRMNNLDFNDTSLYYKVHLSPKNNEYETGYGEIGEISLIKLTFSEPITDLNMIFDIKIIDKQGKQLDYVNILMYNYLNKEIVLNEYKSNKLNTETILETANNEYNLLNKNNIQNNVVNSGLSIKNANSPIFIGGDYNNEISVYNCGGGTGYIGGNYALNYFPLNDTIEYNPICSAGGGTSYINNEFVNKEFENKKYCDNFITNYNNGDGLVFIYHLDKEEKKMIELNHISENIGERYIEKEYKYTLVNDLTILELSLSGGYNMLKYKIVFYPDRNIVNSNKNTLYNLIEATTFIYIDNTEYADKYLIAKNKAGRKSDYSKLYYNSVEETNYKDIIESDILTTVTNDSYVNIININDIDLNYRQDIDLRDKVGVDKVYVVIKAPIQLDNYIDIKISTIETI